ncbi:MAG: penicillin-binding protein 1B [Methylovulum sp.]|nr:penicillin-binding protein 1B [Methylovulum sp.]
MATKKNSVRYGAKKNSKKQGTHWFRNLFLLVFAGVLFVLISYLGFLDYKVRQQFDGKRWSIPAHVYANPVELYAGHNLTASKFEELLQQLNYRKDAHLSFDGTYLKNAGQFTVRTRDFTFWDVGQPSALMQLNFTEAGIASITDVKKSEDIALIRMDPVQIGSFYPAIKEDRVLIKLDEAPDALIKGLLASEDRDFYQHYGISMRGIGRAIWANLRAGGMVQGGSTITQQLAKNFYLSSERSLERKIKEAFMALILEFRYSKHEILEAYLNEIYLGQNGVSAVHGFGLASEFYFGSPLKGLPLEQVASLVALVRGPSEYDPRRYPERAVQRRNLVLDLMVKEGYVAEKQALAAKEKPLGIIPRTHRIGNRYPGFLELVKRRLKEEYREEDFTSDGLKIFTTLDTQIQDTLEKTVSDKLNQLEKLPKANGLQTAVIVTRRDSGEIVALVSGRENSVGGFNRALDAVRPIGSLIKPVVYLTALENPKKYTITTSVNDTAIVIRGQNGTDWAPKNYDHREHGRIPLHTALSKSYNLATVRIGMDVGIAKTAKTLKNMGVTREVDLLPSLLLGASELSPMDVTQMYQTLAGDGFLTPIKAIRAVIAANGEHLQSYPFNVKQAVDPAATYIVNTILQEVMHEGTGHAAYSVFPWDYGLVGKTGTTNDSKDSWFAGYTGDYLATVWVGRDDNKPIGLTGATGALPVWTSLMRQISTQPVTLLPPDNIKIVDVDRYSGLLANKSCNTARAYPYIAGSEPRTYSSCGNEAVEPDKSWFEKFFPE